MPKNLIVQSCEITGAHVGFEAFPGPSRQTKKRSRKARRTTDCEKVLETDDWRLCCWWSLPLAVSTVTPSAVSTMLRLRRITSLSNSTLTTSAGDVMTTGGAACIRTPPPPPAAEAAECWDVGSRRRTSLLLVAVVIDTDGGVSGFKLYISFSVHTHNGWLSWTTVNVYGRIASSHVCCHQTSHRKLSDRHWRHVCSQCPAASRSIYVILEGM